ncbi:RagB/SusD family nutrient uptake outer membrane protein [Chitinophaga agrisoli]|uniref:RagB/SusD family nutrient uptake outer membrane protein n=1 Tax=Chitinophaga agrisoli TaxID=2607653 RepID=A0A5B2VIX4_9BACT|nr:RagB/SusD family nutrient uptake outer membrane protein [Chitinophaga agrisoli]KAA2238480.1 RagB/SusD family nutrient uptake outer membrane protein [Chitinophaga agrisoli]
MNTNHIYRVALFILGLAALASCRPDLLKTPPTDRISSEIYWKTDADATNAATAVYTYLDGINIVFWDGLSDIGHFNTTGTEYAPVDQGVADAQNGRFADVYTNCYRGIRAANYFLDNVDKITVSNASLVNSRKGEVRTLRAYYYLRLVGWFGAVPLTTTGITIDEGVQLSRTDAGAIYDFIANELDIAAPLLPNTQADKGRITKGAALALKARAMLYAGRYAEAATAAKAVMDLNVYTLYPAYKQLFSYAAENNSEVIMDKEFAKDIYSNTIFSSMAPASLASAVPQVVPTKQMADEYEMANGKPITDPASGFDPYKPYDNRDPRLHYSIYAPGDTLVNGKVYNSTPGSGTADAIGGGNLWATTTGFNVRKYINPEDLGTPGNCGINIIVIRYPEVLLTYAEAKIEQNQLDQSVYDAINQVRQRPDVNMPPLATGLSQTQLRAAVRHERTVELAFEGLHTTDIRRWKTAETIYPGPIKGMTYVKNGVLTTVVNNSFIRSFNPQRDYLWPIPQQEIILNKNLVQNPNW